MSSPTDAAVVSVVHAVADRDAAQVLVHELERVGIPARPVARQTERSGGELALVVLLAIPVAAFIKAYAESLGQSLGRATAESMHQLVQRIAGGDDGTKRRRIVVRDQPRGIDIEIDPELPAEAYELLVALDPQQPGTFRYERVRAEWIAANPGNGARPSGPRSASR